MNKWNSTINCFTVYKYAVIVIDSMKPYHQEHKINKTIMIKNVFFKIKITFGIIVSKMLKYVPFQKKNFFVSIT